VKRIGVFLLICICLLSGCGSTGESLAEDSAEAVTETVTAELSDSAEAAELDGPGGEFTIPGERSPSLMPRIDPNRVYRIGQVGPAGGIVFYDKGRYAEGWRYLEAAPPIMEFYAGWSALKVIVNGTEDTIGSGKYNTILIVSELAKSEESEENAANLCQTLIISGYDDWFLPSLLELDQMYENLKNRADIGGFVEELYWSSTEKDFWGQNFGMALDFADGNQTTRGKSLKLRVRAIRAF
jgi:hypothetical protein